MTKPPVTIVNNSGFDFRDLPGAEDMLLAFVKHGTALPAEYFEDFDVKIIEVDGYKRAVINWR